MNSSNIRSVDSGSTVMPHHERQRQWHTQIELHRNPNFHNTTPQPGFSAIRSQSSTSKPVSLSMGKSKAGCECGCTSSGVGAAHNCPCDAGCDCKSGSFAKDKGGFQKSTSWGTISSDSCDCDERYKQNVNPKACSYDNVNPKSRLYTMVALPSRGMRTRSRVSRRRVHPTPHPTIGLGTWAQQHIDEINETKENLETCSVSRSSSVGLGDFAELHLSQIRSRSQQLKGTSFKFQHREGFVRRARSVGLGDFATRHIDEIQRQGDNLWPAASLSDDVFEPRLAVARDTDRGVGGGNATGLGDFVEEHLDEVRDAARQHKTGAEPARRTRSMPRGDPKVAATMEGIHADFDKAKAELKATAYEISAGFKKIFGGDAQADLAKAEETRAHGDEKREEHLSRKEELKGKAEAY